MKDIRVSGDQEKPIAGFEKLWVWQRAHELMQEIHKVKGFNTVRKEAGETQNQVRQLAGKGYLESQKSQQWVERYEEVIRGINGFVNYIRDKRDSHSS